MVSVFSKVVILIFVVFVYREYKSIMSRKSPQDDVFVNIGGKRVPVSSINKPHSVLIDPHNHKQAVNAETFPDVETDAKNAEALKNQHAAILEPNQHKPVIESFPAVEPEAKDAEALKNFEAAILEPNQHKPVIESFPDVEPEAKEREAKAKLAKHREAEKHDPHAAVIEPQQHQPVIDPESFPDVEPEAKVREAA